MKTNEIFRNYNRNLILRLIPSKELPIYCNSVLEPNDDVINFTIKQNGIK